MLIYNMNIRLAPYLDEKFYQGNQPFLHDTFTINNNYSRDELYDKMLDEMPVAFQVMYSEAQVMEITLQNG